MKQVFNSSYAKIINSSYAKIMWIDMKITFTAFFSEYKYNMKYAYV